MKKVSTLDANNIIQYLDASELVFFLAIKDIEQKTIVDLISINDIKFTTDLVNSVTCMVEDYSLPIEEVEDGFDYAIHRANGSIANLKFDDIYVFENVPSLELIAQNIENNKYILEKSNMPKISFSKLKEKSRLER